MTDDSTIHLQHVPPDGESVGHSLARCFALNFEGDGFDASMSPIPDSFQCALTLEVMTDPVMTCDGHVYERSAITDWFRRCRNAKFTSPKTGLLLNSMGVVPLQALKAAIETYLRHRPELKRLQEDKASLDLAGSTLQSDLETKLASLNTSESRIAELRRMIEQKDLLLRNSATPSQRLRNTIDLCKAEQRDMDRLTHDVHLAEVESANLQEVLQIARGLLSQNALEVPGHSSSSGGRGDDPPDLSSGLTHDTSAVLMVPPRSVSPQQGKGRRKKKGKTIGNDDAILAEAIRRNDEIQGQVLELSRAAKEGDLSTLRKLCDGNIDVNAVANSVSGATALHAAATGGQAGIAEHLCSRGANKNQGLKDSKTPLFIAAFKGHEDVVRVLCNEGVDKDKADNAGATALSTAAEHGHLAVVRILCEAGAIIGRVRQDGKTETALAAAKGHRKVVQFLQDHLRNRQESSADQS